MTIQRTKDIQAAGYDVIEIFEHDIIKQIRMNKTLATFFEASNANYEVRVVEPRRALYGGRSEVV